MKCDETTPTCLRCLASQRTCEYPTPKNGEKPKRTRSKSILDPSLPGPSRSNEGVPTLGFKDEDGFNLGLLVGKEEKISPKQLSPSEVFNMTPSVHGVSVSPRGNVSRLLIPRVEAEGIDLYTRLVILE